MKHTRSYVVLGTALLLSGGLLFTVNWADAAKSEWISFASNRTGNKVQAVNGIFQSECAWSPDGKQIAFSIIVPRDDRMHLCVIDVDGKNFRQLTQGGPILKPAVEQQLKPVIAGKQLPVTFPLPEIGSPAWSPDGKWIVYAFSETIFWRTADIYIIDVEGNGRGTPLVKDAGRNLSPAWVPEGFFSVSPSAEKRTTLWGKLKQMEGTSK